MGKEEDESGIFFGRVPRTNIGITYVPNVDEMTVCVATISAAD